MQQDLLGGIVSLFCIFFFFQAEDGIRDVAVTGVQTCALPICAGASPITFSNAAAEIFSRLLKISAAAFEKVMGEAPALAASFLYGLSKSIGARSEERRVGKECRWRCGTDEGQCRRGECETCST